jgi:hypothetical protein
MCLFKTFTLQQVAGVGFAFYFPKYMGEGRLECSFQRHLHAVDVGLMIKVGTFGDQKFSPWGGVIQEDLHSRHISFGYSHCQDVLHNKELTLRFLMHFE